MPLTPELKAQAIALRKEGKSIGEIEAFLDSNIAKTQERPGIMDTLRMPEAKAREGLGMLTNALTPSRADIEAGRVGIPGIAARTAGETLTEVAPSFVSPASILTAGALKGLQLSAPAINAAGRGIGRTLERTSGLSYDTPGVLREAVKDPLLIFGKGTKAAGKLYKKNFDPGEISSQFQNILGHKQMVKQAIETVGRGTPLSAEEALGARQSLDAIKNKVPQEVFHETRIFLDGIVKTKFKEADRAYSRAVKSEALREFFGINKTGTPSLVKGGVMLGLAGTTAPLLSPLVQGLGASTLGAAKMAASPLVANSRLGLLSGMISDFAKKNKKRNAN